MLQILQSAKKFVVFHIGDYGLRFLVIEPIVALYLSLKLLYFFV